MSCTGGVQRGCDLHQPQAGGGGESPAAHQAPQGLCVSVRGAGDGFRASEFLQMSSALAQQAAIASHVDVGSNC